MAANATINVACFDLKRLTGYFRGIALAMQIQGNTRAEWKDYDESTVLNVAYALLPWKQKPGTVEVVQDWKKIRQGVDARTSQMLNSFISKLHSGGGGAAMAYLDQMQHVRQTALQSVQQMFAEVGQINREIANEAGQGARNLATVQFAATITLAGIGCAMGLGAIAVPFTTGVQAAGIGLGYNIAGTFIKEKGQVSRAGAVAILTEGAKTATGTGMDACKDPAARLLAQHGEANAQILREAEQRVAQLNQTIARKRSAAKISKLQRQVAGQQQVAAKAGQQVAMNRGAQVAGKVLTKGIPIIFFAHDAWNAYSDWADVYDQTR